MSVALSATVHAAAAAAGAAAGVEHQASSVDERGGLKMKIKRKNNGSSANGDGGKTDSQSDASGSGTGKSRPVSDGLRSTDSAASPRAKQGNDSATGPKRNVEADDIAVQSRSAVVESSSSKSTAKQPQQQNATGSKDKDSTLGSGGRRSIGSGKGNNNEGVVVPRSKVKATGKSGGAKSKKAAAAIAAAGSSASSEDQSATLNGFDSADENNVAGSDATHGHDSNLSAKSDNQKGGGAEQSAVDSKKPSSSSFGSISVSGSVRPVDPYEFESTAGEMTSESDLKAEVGGGLLSGRHLAAHRQQQQQQQQQQMKPEVPADLCPAGSAVDSDATPVGRCDVGVDTLSIGVTTDPDCLGPCEPGTSVVLEGIVWSESNNGILVVNVTWRGKTYVGTLMDSTRHDWAPPRFRDDSPSSDEHVRGWRGSGNSSSTAGTPDVTTEGRRLRKCRRDNNGTGHQGGAGGSRARPPEDRRRAAESKKAKMPAASTSTVVEHPAALFECPEPNCSKKYRDPSGLVYHQSHAHRKSVVDMDTEISAGDAASTNSHQHHPPSRGKQSQSSAKRAATCTSGSAESATTTSKSVADPVEGSGKASEDDANIPCKKARVNRQTSVDELPVVKLSPPSVDGFSLPLTSGAAGDTPPSVKTEIAKSPSQAAVSKSEPFSVPIGVKQECMATEVGVNHRVDERVNGDVVDWPSNGAALHALPPDTPDKAKRCKDLLQAPRGPSSVIGGDAISPTYSDISDSNLEGDGHRSSRESTVGSNLSKLSSLVSRDSSSVSAAAPSASPRDGLRHDGIPRTPNQSENTISRSAPAGATPRPNAADRCPQDRKQTPVAVFSDGAMHVPPRPPQPLPPQQQQAAALEYIQMESMRQAYLQMFGAAGAPQAAVLPYGYSVDPAMAYRMQLMAAAASGCPSFHQAQYERMMADGLMQRVNGAAAADSKPVDMSAKRPSGPPDRPPSGSGSRRTPPTPASTSSSRTADLHYQQQQQQQQQQQANRTPDSGRHSSGSSRRDPKDGVPSGRILQQTANDGQSSDMLMQQRSAGIGIDPAQQRYRNCGPAASPLAGGPSSSAAAGRPPAITPKAAYEDDSSKARWTTTKDAGRPGDPSPTSPTGMPASPGLGAGTPQNQRLESSQTKRHVHTHHHTHVINSSPYPALYAQYPATTLLSAANGGAPPLVPVAFPDIYNPK